MYVHKAVGSVYIHCISLEPNNTNISTTLYIWIEDILYENVLEMYYKRYIF